MIRKVTKIREWNPIKGDDLPFYTLNYRDVPDGFRIVDIDIDMSDYPDFADFWETNKVTIDRMYKGYEINADTLADFYDNLTTDLLQWIAYYDALISNLKNAVISKGYTISRIKSGTDSETENGSSQTTDRDTVDISETGLSKDTVLAFDSSNTEPSNRTDSQDNHAEIRNGNINNSSNRINTKSNTESETITNVKDASDYYEQMIKIYPNLNTEIARIFESNFFIQEVLIW